MQELVFPQIPVEGWVLYTYEHGFLDGPGMIVYFLMNYTEMFWVHGGVQWWCYVGGWGKVP